MYPLTQLPQPGMPRLRRDSAMSPRANPRLARHDRRDGNVVGLGTEHAVEEVSKGEVPAVRRTVERRRVRLLLTQHNQSGVMVGDRNVRLAVVVEVADGESFRPVVGRGEREQALRTEDRTVL